MPKPDTQIPLGFVAPLKPVREISDWEEEQQSGGAQLHAPLFLPQFFIIL